MTRIRLILTWLILAALPLQGMGAASMRLCHLVGAGAEGAVDRAVAGEAGHLEQALHRADLSQGLHAEHAGHADHVGHGVHAAPADPTPAPAEAEPQARAGTDPEADGVSLADAAHRCGACSQCCHVMALATPAVSVDPGAAPRLHSAVPSPRVHTRGVAVPDKPPRA